MKILTNYRYPLLFLIGYFFTIGTFCQSTNPVRARLSASYVKIVNDRSYIDMRLTARIDKSTVGVANVELTISNEWDEDSALLGKVATNMNGQSTFVLPMIEDLHADSTGVFHLRVAFAGNDEFRKTSRSVTFKDADIDAKIFEQDSSYFIKAVLKDIHTSQVIADEPLSIQVDRLFQPLKIGEEFYFTNDNGEITAPLERDIPGIDGIIGIMVVLDDSDDYGTLKHIQYVPIGKPFVDESTFDQRAMWSPRSKTPWFLLILSNSITFGIWIVVFYLIRNLFKIRKANMHSVEN